MSRRRFMRLLGVAGAGALITPLKTEGSPRISRDKLVRFPEKTDLILRTDRPPQLETPLHYFREDVTPNEAFYVRWHLEGIPTSVDLGSFRLQIGGHVQRSFALSVTELRRRFE